MWFWGLNPGGVYSKDDINELVKEDEVDGAEPSQKTKGKKGKTPSIQPRKRKQGGLSLEEEEKDASRSEEDASGEQEKKGPGSEDARKKKEEELWASFLSDVGPKPKGTPSTQVKRENEAEETSSSKVLVKAEDQEKPRETEKVKITKVFDFAGEEVRVTKEVDAISKEVKSFFKQNEKEATGCCPFTCAGAPCWIRIQKVKWHKQPLGENWSQETEAEHPREVQLGLGELQRGGRHW